MLAVAVLVAAGLLHAQRGAPGPTAIVGARLVDGTGAAPIGDAVVVVEGDRIRAAGPRARTQIPSAATVVDAQGKVVIPGLGSIRSGKAADLEVLDADPTVDINNTTKINRVMRAGRWVD